MVPKVAIDFFAKRSEGPINFGKIADAEAAAAAAKAAEPEKLATSRSYNGTYNVTMNGMQHTVVIEGA
jgi:hypothetical protein